MIADLHTHVLPCMDDGSASVEESIAMLQREKEQGITHVVATPHFYPRYDSPEAFLEKRDRAEALLRQAMAAHEDLPRLTVGAEVYYFRGMSESDLLPRLTIGQESCILIEMPHAHWTDEMYADLAAIWERRRILPIIAHVDRYIGPWNTHGIPEKLAQLPVFVQANASFFLERATAGMAMRMLKADRIQLLGSDCHNMESRKPNLAEAARRIERKLGSAALDRIRGYEKQVLGL